MKTLTTIHGYDPTWWEMWSTFNLLRGLGFTRDDIFAILGTDSTPGPTFGKTCGFIELRTQKKSFRVVCGVLPPDTDKTTFSKTWVAFIDFLPTIPTAEATRVYVGSAAFREKVLILNRLVEKGFRLPLGAN